MSKILVGYGYTNNKGIATLDYDAEGNQLQTSGYTGTGAGDVDFIAQYHDGTTEFLSRTCGVIDAITKDIDNSMSLDYYFFARSDVSETNNEKVMVRNQTGACYITPTSDTSKNFNKRLVFDVPFRVEFDITRVDSTFHTIMQTETEGTGSFWSVDLTETGHYSIDMLPNSQIMKKGTTVVGSSTLPIVKSSFLLYNGSNSTGSIGEQMSFKNIVIYPIK